MNEKKNYMRVKTEREREEIAEQDVKSERVHETETYQQLRITTNKERNIEEQNKKVKTRKCEVISREIDVIGTKNQVGKDEIKVKVKLFETCLMAALTNGMEAWGNKILVEMSEIDKIQINTL